MTTFLHKYRVSIFVAAAALLFLVFGASLRFDFLNWDDTELLTQHPWFQQITFANIFHFWNPMGLRDGILLDYSPIRDMSYALDRLVFGWKPWGFHFTQVLIHASNALLIFCVLRKRTSDLQATLIAMLWSTHPLCVEPVVWVSSRKDVLFTVFFLLAWYFDERRKPKVSFFSGVCSLLSKYTSVILGPFLLLKRSIGKKNWIGPALLTGIAFCLGGFAMWANHEKQTLVSVSTSADLLKAWPAGFQMITQVAVSCLWPIHLSARYVQHPDWGWSHWQVVLGFFLWISLLIGAMKKESLLLALLGLFPAMLQISVGHPIWMADRYAYLPLIGLVWFFIEKIFLFFRKAASAIAVALVFVLSIISFQRVKVWESPMALWQDTAKKSPEFYLNQGNLGYAYLSDANPAAAVAPLEKALWINPSWSIGYAYLADAYLQLGKKGMAEAVLRKLEGVALPLEKTYDSVYEAVVWAKLGHQDQAKLHFEKMLSKHPEDPHVLANYGVWQMMNKNTEQALKLWQRAIEVVPSFALARLNRAIFRYSQSDCHGAIEELGWMQRASKDEQKTAAWLVEQCNKQK